MLPTEDDAEDHEDGAVEGEDILPDGLARAV